MTAKSLIALAAAAMSLAACGHGGDSTQASATSVISANSVEASQITPTVRASATSSAATATSVSSTPDTPPAPARSVEISCGDLTAGENFIVTVPLNLDGTVKYPTAPTELKKWRDCSTVPIPDSPLLSAATPLQVKALKTFHPEYYDGHPLDAGLPELESGALFELYAECARTNTTEQDKSPLINLAQLEAALLLCPSSPRAGEMRATLATAKSDAAAEKNGDKVYGGTHKVPSEMKYGTWVATDVENCYWETRDANGEILDNNFVMAAPRVVATVGSDAVVFTGTGCGPWRREG